MTSAERLLKVAKDMRKLRIQLKAGKVTAANARTQARIAEVEIRALIALNG